MTEFKIAKIISDTSVVINGGRKQGVKESDEFTIYGKSGEEVVDPDTGEVLGTLDIVKGTVRAIVVYENMSICENTERTEIGSMGVTVPFNQMLRVKPLKVEKSQITGGFSGADKPPIVIGDSATKN